MKSAKSDWLTRLGGSQQFFSVADQPASRPVWSMGGLAAGALPALVRSSHGYVAQLPSDAPDPLRDARPGDFFRT